MKSKWFWGTLVFWIVFAVTLTGRALIYSNLKLDPQIISQYEIKTNGLTQSHKLWVNEGSLTDLLPLLSDHLRQEGWVSCAGGKDLIPDLLQIDGLVPDISEKLQVKMFQKPGFHMALGLLQPSGETKTYGWEGVVPDGVFGIAQARRSWDLPFPLPPDTKRLMNEKLENFQIAILILPTQKDLPGRFQALCQEGHWESTVWKSSDANPVFLITKGNNKLMAVLNRQPSEDMITLVKFDQRKELL